MYRGKKRDLVLERGGGGPSHASGGKQLPTVGERIKKKAHLNWGGKRGPYDIYHPKGLG